MIIIFLIILIILFLYYLKQTKNHFSILNPFSKNIIIGSHISEQVLSTDDSKIYIGDNLVQDFITYETQFHLKLNTINKNYYINNGTSCPKQISDSGCFKQKSNKVYETVLLEEKPNVPPIKYDVNEQTRTGLWKFFDIERENNKYVYYGHEVLIKNIGSNVAYICVCDLDEIKTNDCGYLSDIFCYNDINDAYEFGKWIIIPKFFDNYSKDKLIKTNYILTDVNGNEILGETTSTTGGATSSTTGGATSSTTGGNKFSPNTDLNMCIKNNVRGNDTTYNTIEYTRKFDKYCKNSKAKYDESCNSDGDKKYRCHNNTYYDFYKDYKSDYYDFEELKSKKIPISINDEFLIVNSKKIDNKYVYLNICDSSSSLGLSINCNNINVKKAVGTRPNLSILADLVENKMPIYNWSISPITFDMNVYDTLYVKGSLKLNELEINSETLRYIKSIPYFFDKEICLLDTDKQSETYNKKVCVSKDKLEMLNGTRKINVQSIVPSKPFILYSGSNFTGRELKVGFNYEKLNELPYLGEINEWLNPNNHGKWYSMKIDGPYTAVIFNKINFGYGDISGESELSSDKIIDKDTLTSLMEDSGEVSDGSTTESATNNNSSKIEINMYDKKLKEIVSKNPLTHVVTNKGISDVRTLGDDWVNGIKSIVLSHSSGGDSDYYELKCLEKYKFRNQQSVNSDKFVENDLITANFCKNGAENQQFYFASDSDNKFTDSNIYDNIDSTHLHFHRHKYDEEHQAIDP